MEQLKAIFEASMEHLTLTAQKLGRFELLSDDEVLAVLSMLDKISKEQKRCIADIINLTGCSPDKCDSIIHMEQLLEAYHQNQEKQNRVSNLRIIVSQFLAIHSDPTYEEVISKDKHTLAALSDDELIAFDDEGRLEVYKTFISCINKDPISVSDVEPLSSHFGFQVAFGLLGHKYILQTDSLEDSIAVPASSTPAATPNNEAAAQDAEVSDENTKDVSQDNVEDKNADSSDDEGSCNRLILPENFWSPYMYQVSNKKPKGSSSFFDYYKKAGREIGSALAMVSDLIMHEWGCTRAFIDKKLDDYATSTVDRALTYLYKEGYVGYCYLDGEDLDNKFYYMTPSGFSILEKESLQRKIRKNVHKYYRPNISNASEFVRFRAAIHAHEFARSLPIDDFSSTVYTEEGFFGF